MKRLVLTALMSATAISAFAAENIEEVVVTGTLIRGIAPIGQPASTVDNAAIVASGTTNTADLLATQPALNSFNTLPIGGNQAFRSTGATVPGMRGLPGTAVLVMLDGHRLVGDSPLLTTADPSSIPAGAIERVEIIQDGGSATYGSDAVAGVINIILKKNFSGMETTASLTGANKYNAGNVNHTMGKTWSGGSALLSLAYEANGDLLNSDREYYIQDYRRYGGRNGQSITCGITSSPDVRPALNVLLDNGTWFNSATRETLPVTPQGGQLTTTTPARITPPPISQAINCDPARYNQLVNPQRRYAAVGNVRQSIGENLQLFTDFKITDIHTTQRYQPTNLVVNAADLNVPGTRQLTGTLIIPGTNPFFLAPPGYTVTPTSVEQVFVNSGIFGEYGFVKNEFRARSAMLDVGATLDLPGKWQATGDVNFGYSTSQAFNPVSTGPNPNALQAAAFGTTSATALDPFGGRTDPQVVAAIMNWPLLFDALQRIYDVNVRADGPVFSLPGGEIRAAVGLGNRHEQYRGRNPIGAQGQPRALTDNAQRVSRVINSANAEIAVPIVGAQNAMTGIVGLQLSAAVRFDDYSDVGNTTNPKYGIVWSPFDGFSLRGSYGTSFHAPQLADSHAIDTRATANTTSNSPTTLPTNFPGALLLPTLGFAGGKPNLVSEEAKTYSFGFDFKPTFFPGVAISASYFDIKYDNQVIIPQNNSSTINNPALAGTVFIYNRISDTGCATNGTGAAVAPGTGGPCYGPLPQAQVAALLAGVRGNNFTGVPTTWYVTDLRRTNLGTNVVKGIDFDVHFRHDVARGIVSASLSGEYLTTFDIISVPGLPANDALTSGVQYFQNDAGAQSVIPWHARGSLGWQQGAYSYQAAVSYTGGYDYLYTPTTYATNPNGSASGPNLLQGVKPFITTDLNAIYEFQSQSGAFEGVKAQVNVYNIFNERPPFVISSNNNYGGFFSPSASPLGRTFRLTMTKSW